MTTKYSLILSPNEYSLEINENQVSLSLSRVGGQGSQGPLGSSIDNAYVNSSNELLLVIKDHLGGETLFNAGDVSTNSTSLTNIQITSVQDGDMLYYNAATTNWENKAHTLTTASVSDIDSTNKADGAVLLYDGSSSKYKATTQINNSNLYLIGGSY